MRCYICENGASLTGHTVKSRVEDVFHSRRNLKKVFLSFSPSIVDTKE